MSDRSKLSRREFLQMGGLAAVTLPGISKLDATNLVLDMSQKEEQFPAMEKGDQDVVAMELFRGKLTDNGATPWYGYAHIGSPPQSLKVMVDTGTTHTWITSVFCSTAACNAHDKYDPGPRIIDEKIVPINFGPWGQLLAILHTDFWRIDKDAKIPKSPLRFYMAYYYDGSQFQGLACDGGLSIASVNPASHQGTGDIRNETSFTDSDQILDKLSPYIGNNHIANFGFNADEQRGICIFGKCDIQGNANTLPVIKSGPIYMLWTVRLDSFQYSNAEILRNVFFVLDTGSSRFKGDPKYISKIVDVITDGGRLPTILADPPSHKDYKNISLVLNGKKYVLKPEDYFLKIKNEDTNRDEYHLAFHPMEGLENYLLVGSVFLDTVKSSFNRDDSSITLYK